MIYVATKIEQGFPPVKLDEAFSKEWLTNKYSHMEEVEILTEQEYNELLNGN